MCQREQSSDADEKCIGFWESIIMGGKDRPQENPPTFFDAAELCDSLLVVKFWASESF